MLLSLGISLVLVLLWRGIRMLRVRGYQAQLAQIGNQQPDGSARTRYQRIARRVTLWLADHGALLRGFTSFDRMEQQLNYAGKIHRITPRELYGTQLFYALVGLVIASVWGLLGLPFGIALLVICPFSGFYAPQIWLHFAIKRRQNAITLALPDLLDMLAVCIAAGQGFDKALRLLVDHGEGPLYEEIRRVLDEQTVGESYTGAFRRLTERNSSEALRRFVDALLQAETLGTSIATTLEQQAEDMRVFRRHRARAKGAQAATKISLVVVVVVMPSVMCLMFGSVALSIWDSANSVFQLEQ
jgi:tight adherence protein C